MEFKGLQPTSHNLNEQGRATTLAALAVGGLALTVYLSPLDSAAGHALGMFMPSTHVTNAKVAGKQMYTGPIEPDCDVISFFDVSKTIIPLHARLGKKEVKGAYRKYFFEDTSIKEEGQTKEGQTIISLETCEDKRLVTDAPKSVKIDQGYAKDKDSFNETFVTLNSDAIVTKPNYVTDQTTIIPVDGPLWGLGSGASTSGSAAANGLCQIFTLGKKGEACDSLSGKLNHTFAKAEQKGETTARVITLKAIEEQGSKAAWDTTVSAFADKLACTAKEAGGQEALEQLRFKVVGGTPSFKNNFYDEFRGKVLDEKDEDVVVDKKELKIQIEPLETYVPKCFSNMYAGADGWSRFK